VYGKKEMKDVFKSLIVWQKAMVLAREVYVVTEHFPEKENFGLTNQMRRSAVSVPSNIAEGKQSTWNNKRLHSIFAYCSWFSC